MTSKEFGVEKISDYSKEHESSPAPAAAAAATRAIAFLVIIAVSVVVIVVVVSVSIPVVIVVVIISVRVSLVSGVVAAILGPLPSLSFLRQVERVLHSAGSSQHKRIIWVIVTFASNSR